MNELNLASLRTPLNSFPKLSLYVAGFLAGGYVISFIPKAASVLGLVPGYTLSARFQVWSLITSGWFCTSFIGTLLRIVSILFIGRLLEPIWGTREFLTFIAFVNFFAAVVVYFGSILAYGFTQNEKYLFPDKPYTGFIAALSGFTVAAKQLFPNHEVVLFFTFGFRAKLVPLLWVLASLLYWLLGGSRVELFYIYSGLVIGYIYLRFFQLRTDGSHGDESPSFSFASFFPEAIQPVVVPLSNVLYGIFCKCFRERRDITPQYTYPSVPVGQPILPGSNAIDAERRKKKALITLNHWLGEGPGGNPPVGTSTEPPQSPAGPPPI